MKEEIHGILWIFSPEGLEALSKKVPDTSIDVREGLKASSSSSSDLSIQFVEKI